MKLAALLCLLSFNCYCQCESIKKKVDKFTGETSFESPGKTVTFHKSIKNNDTLYFLGLSTYSSYYHTRLKGVIILFSDSVKIIRENESVNSIYINSDNTLYTSFLMITKDELEILRDNNMTDFRIGTRDKSINKSLQTTIKKYAECILKL